MRSEIGSKPSILFIADFCIMNPVPACPVVLGLQL